MLRVIIRRVAVAERPSRERGKRVELQRMLGELGVVLPRFDHGTAQRPAQGWYAELYDGGEVYLGDYFALAAAAIVRISGDA